MKKLNFGCGKIIKHGWVNVDIQRGTGIDKSFDFEKFPYPFKDNTFDYVLIDNVIAQLGDLNLIFKEIHRICKKNAILEIITPYYNTYYAYADSNNNHFFNEIAIKQLFEGCFYDITSPRLFKIEKLEPVPQKFLKLFPKRFIKTLGRLIGNVIVEMRVRVRVLK